MSQEIGSNVADMAKKPGQVQAFEYNIDPEEEKAVVRKLDRIILPVMAFVYFFQYLDKQNIGYAAIFGLREDTHLEGADYSWTVSLFYFGQLCSEYPAAYLMSRFPLKTFVGTAITLWGITEMCMASVNSFASLAAVRFLLGFTEGAVSPTFLVITSNWYKKSEHPIRVATWVSMFGISQIIGPLLMYGIGVNLHSTLEPWRVMFLVCGAFTILSGILFIGLVPKHPSTAWFLNENERRIATERLAADRATMEQNKFDMAQVKDAFTDPRTIVYVLMAFCITFPTPIVKFSSIVIKGFGFTDLQTMLVSMPGGAIAFCLVWIGALGPRYFPNTRCIFGMCLATVPMIGSIIVMTLPATSSWAIVGGTWLAGCTAPPLAQFMALMASNVKGSTKKSVISTMFFVFYCVGCVSAPQLWTPDEGPRYRSGCIASIAGFVGQNLLFLTYMIWARMSNAKRDKAMGYEGEDVRHAVAGVAIDSEQTERQDKGFRYTH